MSDSLVGRMLGAYRIERALGQGGMGAVYVGRHARTGRTYAVKVLLQEHAGQKDALKRFRREAEALGAVGHAHIVAIHDYDETPDGLWFLVMDLLEGEDLAHRLQKTGPMPYQAAIAILDPIASAIQAAHTMGLIHRDLKPSNVFLAKPPGALEEKPMLLDFGLARALDETTGAHGKVTATGMVMGTPSYMSPEQAQGIALDGRSDLWALGILLFEMIAGRPPFEGPTLSSTLVAVLTTPRPRLGDRGMLVPEALEVALDRALAKDPHDRYPDVASFRAALLSCVGARLERSADAQIVGTAPTQAMALLPRTGEGRFPSSTPRTAVAAPYALPTPSTLPGATPQGLAAHPREAGPSRSMVPWVLAAATLMMLAGGLATGLAYFFLVGGRSEVASSVGAPAPTAPAIEPAIEPAPGAPPSAPSVGPAAPTPPEPAPELVAPSTSSRRVARARGVRTSEEPAGEPSEPSATEEPDVEEISPPAAAVPAGGPPPALIRATDLMGVGDYAGCLRELEHAGTSAPILGARMNCALRTGRRSDLEEACTLLHRHHPTHAYTRTCDTLLDVTP